MYTHTYSFSRGSNSRAMTSATSECDADDLVSVSDTQPPAAEDTAESVDFGALRSTAQTSVDGLWSQWKEQFAQSFETFISDTQSAAQSQIRTQTADSERKYTEKETECELLQTQRDCLSAEVKRKAQMMSAVADRFRWNVVKLTQRSSLQRIFICWRLYTKRKTSIRNSIRNAQRTSRNTRLQRSLMQWRLAVGQYKSEARERIIRAEAESSIAEIRTSLEERIQQLEESVKESEATVRVERHRQTVLESGLRQAFLRGMSQLNIDAMSLLNYGSENYPAADTDSPDDTSTNENTNSTNTVADSHTHSLPTRRVSDSHTHSLQPTSIQCLDELLKKSAAVLQSVHQSAAARELQCGDESQPRESAPNPTHSSVV